MVHKGQKNTSPPGSTATEHLGETSLRTWKMLVNLSLNSWSLYSLSTASLSFLFILASQSRLCSKPFPLPFQCPFPPVVLLLSARFYPRSQSFPPSVSMLSPHFSPLAHSLSACSPPKFPGESGLPFSFFFLATHLFWNL